MLKEIFKVVKQNILENMFKADIFMKNIKTGMICVRGNEGGGESNQMHWVLSENVKE